MPSYPATHYVHSGFYEVIKGIEYYVNGRLTFPTTIIKRDGTYRTRFGPCVDHNGKIYEVSNNSLSEASTRLTNTRFPDNPSKDWAWYARQTQFAEDRTTLIKEWLEGSWHLADEYLGWYEEARLHHADPHDKRDARIRAWAEMHVDGGVYRELPCHSVAFKLKSAEVAKVEKIIRGIIDMKVPASLQGFRSTMYIKKMMANEPFDYMGGTIEFCPGPKRSNLKKVFKQLMHPTGRFYFVFFSDDSCYAVRTPHGVRIFNLDIKSCDKSISKGIFDLAINTVPPHMTDDIAILVKQCELPVKIYSLSNPPCKVKLKPHFPRLYSGSTLTTLINNYANILIGMSLAESAAHTGVEIIAAAERVGFLMNDPVECTIPEHIQFLKYSPCLCGGEYWPLLNIGVFFRALGTCRGDLLGDLPEQQLAILFNALLKRGMYPREEMSITQSFQSQLDSSSLKTTVIHDVKYKRILDEDDIVLHFTDEALSKRYGCTADDVQELRDLFTNATFGTFVNNRLTTAALHLDYGLSTFTEPRRFLVPPGGLIVD
jgi:hypothetical protein